MAVNIYTTPIYTIFDILIKEWFERFAMPETFIDLEGIGEKAQKKDLLDAMIERLQDLRKDYD